MVHTPVFGKDVSIVERGANREMINDKEKKLTTNKKSRRKRVPYPKAMMKARLMSQRLAVQRGCEGRPM